MNNFYDHLGRGALLALGLFLMTLAPASAQEQSVRPGINKDFVDPDLEKFRGKFEVESREIFAQRKEIVAACKLKVGMRVADIGAGTGLFTRLFAQEVGPEGRVYAVDIAPRFIAHIKKTSEEAGLKNVVGVVCTPSAVELPPRSIDLAFICDTYHHFEYPHKTLQSIRKALRPGGQMIVIDFHRVQGKSSDWVMDHVRAGQETFTREIVAAGFKQVEEQKFLKENYFLRFALADVPEPADKNVQSFTYKKTKQADLQLFVHYPEGWKKEDKRPVLVFFFGGGWRHGTAQQFEPQAKYFASRGLVAVRVDYRVKSRHDVTPDRCVEDAKSAVRWVRQNAGRLGIDPNRIVAAGGSAGGHLAACTGCCEGLEAEGEDHKISSRPNALLLFNPVLRFHGVPEMAQRIGNDEALAKKLSPTLNLVKDAPPALLLYGTKDGLITHGQEFLARAKELGHRTEMFTAADVGHGFFNQSPWRERTLFRADEFLTSLGYLSGKPTIAIPEEKK